MLSMWAPMLSYLRYLTAFGTRELRLVSDKRCPCSWWTPRLGRLGHSSSANYDVAWHIASSGSSTLDTEAWLLPCLMLRFRDGLEMQAQVVQCDAATNFDQWIWRSHWVIEYWHSLTTSELFIKDQLLCLMTVLQLFKELKMNFII